MRVLGEGMILVMFLLFYFSWMACFMMHISGDPASCDDAGEGLN